MTCRLALDIDVTGVESGGLGRPVLCAGFVIESFFIIILTVLFDALAWHQIFIKQDGYSNFLCTGADDPPQHTRNDPPLKSTLKSSITVFTTFWS